MSNAKAQNARLFQIFRRLSWHAGQIRLTLFAAMFSTRRPPLFWTLLLCSLCAVRAFAARPTFTADPDYLIDTWETEDGLPENSATSMAQTPDGYLWFGTFNGLVRFDGVKFAVVDPHNTPDLPGAGIVCLHSDRSGRLWIGTTSGLVVKESPEAGGGWRRFGTNEGCLAAVAAIEQMVKGPGILNAQFSWDGSKAKGEGRSVNCVIMYDRPLSDAWASPHICGKIREMQFFGNSNSQRIGLASSQLEMETLIGSYRHS